MRARRAQCALVALWVVQLEQQDALTKFASRPGEWHAGQNYTLGYTIRMDGVEPYKADTTEIVIRNGTGKVLSYPGTPDGPAGHYTAKVYFPAAGTYSWQITQGSFFAPYDLGPITVLGPVATSESQSGAPAPASDPLGQATPFAARARAFRGATPPAQPSRTPRPPPAPAQPRAPARHA